MTPKNELRILVQCNELPPTSCGGIGHFVEAQCTWLESSNVDTTVIGVYDKTKFDEPHKFNVIRLWRIPKLGILGILLNQIRFHLYLTYYLTFTDRKIDLIEYQDYEGYGAFHWHRIPFQVRAQSSGFYSLGKNFGAKWYDLRKSIPWRLHRLSIARANHVVYSAHAAKRCSEEFVKNKSCSVVHNFLAPKFSVDRQEVAQTQKPDRPFLFFFGTVTEGKGIFLLLEAFEKLLGDGMDIELKIAGRLADESIRTQIEKLDSGISERVSLLGRVSDEDLISLIQNSTAVVFPSYRENLPLAWIEAMSIGKITIASNIPVTNEIIEDGVTGFVTELNSDSISQAIKKCFSLSDQERTKIEKAAKEFALKHFSIENKMEENVRIWKTIAKK